MSQRIKRKPVPAIDFFDEDGDSSSSSDSTPKSYTLYPDVVQVHPYAIATPVIHHAPLPQPNREPHYRRRSSVVDDILPRKQSMASLRTRKISISSPLSTQSHSSSGSSYINVSPSNSLCDGGAGTASADSSSMLTKSSFSWLRTKNKLTKAKLAPPPTEEPPLAEENEYDIPTPRLLARLSNVQILTPTGSQIPFGALFSSQRTVVIFLRHLFSKECIEYVLSLPSLPPEEVEVILIANGNYALLNKYKSSLGSRAKSVKVFTDPSLELYSGLGMRKLSHDGTEPPTLSSPSPAHSSSLWFRFVSFWHSSKAGGDMTQLGGEFVLGPGLKCSYAHRMQPISPNQRAEMSDIVRFALDLGKDGEIPPSFLPLPPREVESDHESLFRIRRGFSRSVLDIPNTALRRKRQSTLLSSSTVTALPLSSPSSPAPPPPPPSAFAQSSVRLIRSSRTWDGLPSGTVAKQKRESKIIGSDGERWLDLRLSVDLDRR